MDLSTLQKMYQAGGYEIRADDSHILFLNRNTYGVGLGAVISGGLLFILLANTILQVTLANWEVAGIIAIPAGLAAIIFALFARAYFKRKKAAPGDVSERYLLDLKAQTLSMASGQVIAQSQQIAFVCHYNMMSRTYGIYIVLPSKHQILVYAEWVMGFYSKRIDAIRQELERAISSPGH